jgi:hypothetical protein
VNAALLSSERMTWNTPERVLSVVREVAGGKIKCDPCSNETSIVDAEIEYRLDRGQDGLVEPWYSTTFVNPVYGREIGAWTMRAHHLARREGIEVVGLVPARVDTQWFKDCWAAAAICFVEGRLTFLGAPSPAPFPSALVYWGTWRERFASACRDLGKVVIP